MAQKTTHKTTIIAITAVVISILIITGTFFLGWNIGHSTGRIEAKDEYYYSRYEAGIKQGRAELETKLVTCKLSKGNNC